MTAVTTTRPVRPLPLWGWLGVWISAGFVVLITMVVFLLPVVGHLEAIDTNLAEASRAVGGADGNVRSLPSYVADVNTKLASIDGALKPVPAATKDISGSLVGMRGNLEKVDGSLKTTSGSLTTTAGPLLIPMRMRTGGSPSFSRSAFQIDTRSISIRPARSPHTPRTARTTLASLLGVNGFTWVTGVSANSPTGVAAPGCRCSSGACSHR